MTNEQVFNNTCIYEVTGKDAFNFLNNQLISRTNESDVVKYSAICNPKGRIIFTLLLLPHENGVKIAVDAELGDNFYHYVNLRKFRMDLLIKKTNERICIKDTNVQKPDLQSITTCIVDSPATEEAAFWNFMFETGYPWITTKTSEKFIPQHINLDQKNAIDFDKGCYPGQEIIARLHFIGKVKKRMTLMTFDINQNHQAGDKATIDELGREVEFCSPVIPSGDLWRAQIITKIN